MLVAEARRTKTDIFNDALQDANREPQTEAVTPRRQPARKRVTVDDAAVVEAAVAEPTPVDETAPITSEGAAEVASVEDTPTAADTTPDEAAESVSADVPPDDTTVEA
jgi:hypothetical protein